MARDFTFRVMSSEHDASRLPVGSHLIALTSFWREEKTDREMRGWCSDLWQTRVEGNSRKTR